MKEEYLHYAFKKGLFGNVFYAHTGEKVEILEFGEHNLNAGPDFLDAKIQFDHQVWAGAIEFHVKSSDWYRHQHQKDPAYNAVMLHVVHENDQLVKVGNYELPTIELKEKIDLKHFEKYQRLSISKNDRIPCQSQLKFVSIQIIEEQKGEVMLERLWKKSIDIIQRVEMHQGDRKKAFFMTLATVFGGKANALPFTMLVEQINLNWLAKLNYDSFAIEALLLGKAGFLNIDAENQYVKALQNEFDYLKKKFRIVPFSKEVWKYSRMYPQSFPDIRIAQFAALLCQDLSLSNLLDTQASWNSLKQALGNIELLPFWERHYRLDRKSKKKNTQLSDQFLQLVGINVIVPFKYAIGVWEGNEAMKAEALAVLKEIPGENNHITRQWKKNGLTIVSAFDSQSLLAQKKERCNQKKCLFCGIGNQILQHKK